MKIKTTRKEIRECVEEAVMRLFNEGKTFPKGKSDEYGGKKAPKHAKLNKKGFDKKEKGNKGNRNYCDYDEEC